MPEWLRLGTRLLAAAYATLALTGTCHVARAESADFDAVIEALREMTISSTSPASQLQNSRNSSASTDHQFVFPTTLSAEPTLVNQLENLFASFFDQPVDLNPLLQKIIVESAVADVPGVGKILYNPAHSLFFYLAPSAEHGPVIRVATLEDLADVLKKEPGTDPAMAPYTQGFEAFAQLPGLMRDAESREILEVVWATAPRSQEHKDLIKYLLLRPLQQAAAIRNETSDCRKAIDRFVDEVRSGKRAAIPALPGLSYILRPTRFIRQGDHILLVLSEALIARYYVLAQISVGETSCGVVSEIPLFVM